MDSKIEKVWKPKLPEYDGFEPRPEADAKAEWDDGRNKPSWTIRHDRRNVMSKTNEFTPAQIKIIRGIVRDEIARHDKKLEREEERHQQDLDEAIAEAAMTARDWGDL